MFIQSKVQLLLVHMRHLLHVLYIASKYLGDLGIHVDISFSLEGGSCFGSFHSQSIQKLVNTLRKCSMGSFTGPGKKIIVTMSLDHLLVHDNFFLNLSGRVLPSLEVSLDRINGF